MKSSSTKAQTQEGEYDGVNYSARDSMIINLSDKIVTFYGDVDLISDDIRLTANKVIYNTKKRELCAYGTKDSLENWIGRPVFTQAGSSFTQDEVCYNLRTQKGFSKQALTQEGELVFHAGQSKRHPSDEIHISNGKFTTCDAENPHYHFHLRKAVLIPNDKVVSGPLYMKFRKIPTPLALPFAWFPIKRDERSHGILLPSYGDAGQLGFFLMDLGYYIPIGQHWDTRLMADIYSGGSWAIRNVSQYNYRYKSSGNFELSYNRQVAGLKNLPGYSVINNFFVRWDHTKDSKSKPNQRFNASINFGSTGNFQQNLNSSLEEYLTNTFQSSIQWSYNSPRSPFSLTSSARHSQNSLTGLVTLTLPSVTLNMNRRTISDLLGMDKGRFKLLDDINISYNTRFENLCEISDTAISSMDFEELNLENGFKHNVTVTSSKNFGFLTLSPTLKYDEFTGFNQKDIFYNALTDTLQERTNSGLFGARNFSTSLSANTRIYGMFTFKEKRINAIRHVITPTISASYTPARTRETSIIFNEQVYEWNPWVESRFTPVDVRESGSMNFSLNHNIEAKVKDNQTGDIKKIKILESLTTSTGYNFLADEFQLANISTSGFTSLFNKINLNFNATQSAYGRNTSGVVINEYLVQQGNGLLRLVRANGAVGTRFNGGKDKKVSWNGKIDYTMNIGRNWNSDIQADTTAITHGVAFNGDIHLFSKLKIDLQTGYDLVLKEFTPTQINLNLDLHCWEFSFNWIPNGYRKSFALKINIKAPLLKDIKLEARGSNGQLLF